MIFHKRNFLIITVVYFITVLTSCSEIDSISEGTPDHTAVSLQATATPQPQSGDTTSRPVDGMTMVYIPAGSFQMGSTDAEIEKAITLCREHYSICNRWYYNRESPLHEVSLNSFWLDQTEVTNSQYRKCVEDGKCSPPDTCKKGEPTFSDAEKSTHPVVCVDWEEAEAYCQWAGASLPTEAEWEYAYRGEQRNIFAWGIEFDGEKLNYCDINCKESHQDDRFDDGYIQTAPVGKFPQGASWSGALNMAGNVSEWVGDWLGAYSTDDQVNPQGPTNGDEKMIKGCSWFFHPTYCRGALRASIPQSTTFDYVGFRCSTVFDG